MATDWEKTSNVWPPPRPAFAALSQHLKGTETVLYRFCQPPVRTWVLTGIPIWHLTGKVVVGQPETGRGIMGKGAGFLEVI